MRVVAEGVETQAAWDMRSKLGCPAAQGYLLSAALPAHRFYAWVGERNDERRAQGELLPAHQGGHEIIKLVEYRASDLV